MRRREIAFVERRPLQRPTRLEPRARRRVSIAARQSSRNEDGRDRRRVRAASRRMSSRGEASLLRNSRDRKTRDGGQIVDLPPRVGRFRPDPPNASVAMNVVVLQNPIGGKQTAVRCLGQADGPEILAADDERLGLRCQRRPLRMDAEAVDPMIAPRGRRAECRDIRRGTRPTSYATIPARGLARARDHLQRAGQLAVPGRKRMDAAASVAESITVIAPRNDVQHAARGAVIGVVVDGKHPAEAIDARGVRDSRIRSPRA